VTLASTGEIAGNFSMRQHIAFEAGDERGGFDALVQKHCDELVVVGLTPFGSRAFSLRQRGVEVEVETRVEIAWPFPPERILLDIHRAFLLPLPDPPPPDGVRELRWKDEVVTERWAAGLLRERRFRRADGMPPEEVVIRYADGISATHPARQLRIDNRRFGYQLEVTTVERHELGCP
jgi:hypothetical protein